MKNQQLLLLVGVLITLSLSSSERNKVKQRSHNKNKVHKSHLKSEEDPAPAPASSPAVDNVLSKAKTGLYPLYPETLTVAQDKSIPVMLMTQDVQGQSILNRHDLDFEEKCNLKQGYLAMVIDSKTEQGLQGRQVITAKPVFVVLNKKTLTLFANENVKSLIQSYQLVNLDQKSYKVQWSNSYCFQLASVKKVKNLKPDGSPDIKDFERKSTDLADFSKKQDVILTLCAADGEERSRWIKAINEFHMCEVKPVTTVAAKEQSFMRTIQDEDEETEVERHNADDEQIEAISNSLDGIDDQVQTHLSQIRSQKKVLEQQDQQVDQEIEKAEEESNCLQENLFKEMRQSEQNVEFNLESKTTKDIIPLIQQDDLDSTYKDRLYRILQHKKNLVKEKQKTLKNLRDQMMTQVQQAEKNYDSKSCYGDDILLNKQATIKGVCHNIYKDFGIHLVVKDLLDCLNENTFCLSCCSNFIGASHLEKRQTCIEECAVKLKGAQRNSGLTLEISANQAVTDSDLAYGPEPAKTATPPVTPKL